MILIWIYCVMAILLFGVFFILLFKRLIDMFVNCLCSLLGQFGFQSLVARITDLQDLVEIEFGQRFSLPLLAIHKGHDGFLAVLEVFQNAIQFNSEVVPIHGVEDLVLVGHVGLYLVDELGVLLDELLDLLVEGEELPAASLDAPVGVLGQDGAAHPAQLGLVALHAEPEVPLLGQLLDGVLLGLGVEVALEDLFFLLHGVAHLHQPREDHGEAAVHLLEDFVDGLQLLALEKLLAVEEYLHAPQVVLAQGRDRLDAVVDALLDVDELQLQQEVLVVVQLWPRLLLCEAGHGNYNQMKKKESNSEKDPEIYVFETPEEDTHSNSTPAELLSEPRRTSIQHSKFQESIKQHFKQKNSFNAHVLKQNLFKKDARDDEYDDLKIQTPAELKELNQLCEEIFIASDMGYDLNIGADPDEELNSIHDVLAMDNESAIAEEQAIQQERQTRPESPLRERDANVEAESEVTEEKSKPQPPKIEEKKEPKICGLMIYQGLNNTQVEITNKISLLINPIPPGIILNCKLRRSKDFLRLLSPQYDFFLDNGLKHIVSAQKKILSSKEAFLISTELGSYHKESIVASLRANVLRNQFLVTGKEQGRDVKFKFVYGAVNYGKLNKDKTQRAMQVTIPIKVNVGVRSDHIHNFSFDSLNQLQKLTLIRKDSSDDKSEKNLVLVDQDDDDYNYLKFTKDSDNLFSIEIQHPLSPLQAFGVVLTRFDAQLR